MGSEEPRRSLFHRIADSITGFVPSSILPTVNAAPRENCEVSDTKSDLKRTNEFVEAGDELEPENKLRGSEDHSAFISVDLDASDNSESEFSLRSFSTSGVSSLMPRSWLPGPKPEQKTDDTISTSRLYSRDIFVKPNGCNALRNDVCQQPPLLNTLWNYPRNPYPPPKRQKLSPAQSLGPACSYRPRMRTTYGGASSCRNARELFEFTTPLKFELCKEQISQGSNISANISSTARRILETLEHFSTPLNPGTSQSTRLRYIKRVKVHTRCHRFPPFSGDYQKMKMFPNEPEKQNFRESENSDVTHSEIDAQPPKCYEVSTFTEKQEVQKCSAHESKGNLTALTTEVCHEVTGKPSPSFTFSDPIHKICGSDSERVSSFSTDQRYVFSCPSRSCTKCSQSLLFPQRSSALQSINRVSSPEKSKDLDVPAWRCETCLLENTDSSATCKGCSIPKPKSPQCTEMTCLPSVSLPSATADPTFDSVPINTESASKWECPTCMVFNQLEETKCICCQTSKPLAKMKGTWECPTCMVQNDNELDKCPCCSTDKPGSRPNQKIPTGIISFPTLTSVPPSKFKFGFSLPMASDFKESKAVTSSGFTVTQADSVASNKNVGFSFGVSNNVFSQSKQTGSPSCVSSHLHDDSTTQNNLSTQLEISKDNGTKGFGGGLFSNAVSDPSTSSLTQKSDTIIPELSSSKGYVFGGTLLNGTEKTNLFTFGSSSASGINGFTFTPSMTFSNRVSGSVFQFGAPSTISGNVPNSNISSVPQHSAPTFSNHVDDQNAEVRKKAHAVRRIRR